MAEATALRNNALGTTAIYGQTYTVVFPMLDADGDLVTGATTPDAERSLNGDTFADCTNESTEIATNSGMYYLTLTAAEMTADIVAVIAKSATAGMKTTAIVLYPQKLVTVRTGTAADDGSGTGDIVLDSGASAVDDYYNGMVVAVVIDGAASAEVRVITDYVGSTKTATVSPGFNTAVDNTDTFTIYLPPGQTFQPHVEKIYSDTTIVTSDLAEVDTSDIHSLLTLVRSDTTSLASDLAEGDFSDILSRLTIIASDTAHIESDVVRIESDTQSLASDLAEGDFSDILSRLTVTNSQLLIVKSDTSDIRSALVIIASDTAHIESDAVRIESDTQSLASDLAEGDFSDILSRLTVTNSQLLIVKSDTSDIRSALVIIASDTAAIEAGGGALTATQASQLTRIQSDVITVASDLAEVDTSDIHSLLTKVYSDTTVLTAGSGALTSDQDSKLTRVANAIVEVDTSDLMSMLTLIRSDTTSLASDLAEGDFSDILSRLTIIASDTAHIESDAVRIESDTQSLASDLAEGDFSDILSRLTVTNSQLLIVKSDTSDIRSHLVVIHSETTAIQAAGGALSSDQDSKLTRVANAIVEVDTSDLMSMLTLIRSDTAHIESDAVRILSDTTAIHSDTALATDARSEPGQGAPAASATPQAKVDYLYKAWRNKTEQTATEYRLYADNETTLDHKATTSDDTTTFTRTEVTTGA